MRSKYGAIKTMRDGIRFASKLESEIYLYLKLKGIEILELQPRYLLQEKFKYGTDNIRSIEYVADFLISHKGKEIVLDAKWMETTDFKLKLKLWKFLNQDKTIAIVKSPRELEKLLLLT